MECVVVSDLSHSRVYLFVAASRQICPIYFHRLVLLSFVSNWRTGKYFFSCVSCFYPFTLNGCRAYRNPGSWNQYLDVAESTAKKNSPLLDLIAFRWADYLIRFLFERSGPNFCRLFLPRMDASPSLLSFPEANQIPKLRPLVHRHWIFCFGFIIPFYG